MNKVRKFVVALLAIVLVFTSTNVLATTCYCNLDKAKEVESTNSCTAKNNHSYKVIVSHGSTSASSILNAGLNEWDLSNKAYKYRSISLSVRKGLTDFCEERCNTGYWAKVRVTASGSKGSGRGSITNEF